MARNILIRGKTGEDAHFGIRQRSNGCLRAVSPCCARHMTEAFVLRCRGCKKEWNSLANKLDAYQLDCDVVVVPEDDIMLHALREWAERATGKPLELTVSS